MKLCDMVPDDFEARLSVQASVFDAEGEVDAVNDALDAIQGPQSKVASV